MLVSIACYFLTPVFGYRVVALLLMVAVSFLAMFFQMWPVLTAAILSALTWNFFFIPPRFTFNIHNAEDALMFLMYFIIASLNAVLTTRIRKYERVAQEKKERENAIGLYNTILNSLSHELRTPIATIIGATDNLQAMSERLTELDKHELVAQISRASLQLNRQVGNLLNISRLESGTIKPRKDWVDINELIHSVVNDLREESGGKPVYVKIAHPLPLLKLDYGLVSQILYNLIHNAIVHIPKYAVITVKAYSKGADLVITVEDTGFGIPKNETEKIFDKFYRSKSSATGGTGLGLSIAKGFVEAMGGRIWAENMEEGGARFSLEIPVEFSYSNTNLKS